MCYLERDRDRTLLVGENFEITLPLFVLWARERGLDAKVMPTEFGVKIIIGTHSMHFIKKHPAHRHYDPQSEDPEVVRVFHKLENCDELDTVIRALRRVCREPKVYTEKGIHGTYHGVYCRRVWKYYYQCLERHQPIQRGQMTLDTF